MAMDLAATVLKEVTGIKEEAMVSNFSVILFSSFLLFPIFSTCAGVLLYPLAKSC